MRARYYDPATGQFLTRDPIEAITRSPYAYVFNNPVNLTDPTGLCCKIPGFVPVVGGKCIDLADPDCESNGERLIDSISGEGMNSACVGGQGYLVFGVKLEACWNWQGRNFTSGRPGVTPGIGMGTPSAGVGVGVKHSNACDFSEVGGLGVYGGGGVGPFGVEGSAGVSDFGPDGRPIYSGGGSIGKNWFPWPEVHGGMEFTWLFDW
ncbi:MAG: RHS repeat-associated core domain-containing protein [Candidatus Limnocylindria bacterium]